MKSRVPPAIWLNMLLDALPLGWAVYLTYVGASATNIPDAGLVVIVTVPLIGVLAVDLAILYGLGLRQRAKKLFLGYYAVTRAIGVWALYRLLLNSSYPALRLAVPVVFLALAGYTIRVVYLSIAKR
jgi:hypothetical protein